MIKLLNQAEREILTPIFTHYFKSEVPDENQANIVAKIENNAVTAFLTSEVLIRVGLVWTHPQIRGIGGAKAIGELTKYVRESIPKGASVIAIATTKKEKKLFKKFGMREIEGAIYRIDL